MNHLQQQLRFWQRNRPDHPALEGHHRDGGTVTIHYGALASWQQALTELWHLSPSARVVALLCDNTPDTTLLDLALMADGIATVPIPPYFSPEQIRHLLTQAKVDTIVSDQPQRLRPLLQQLGLQPSDEITVEGSCTTLHSYRIATPRGGGRFDKITYTSGSTGNPKGVCLRNSAMLRVARSLQTATAANQQDRHLALLPYATLLENIGGIYVPLMAGATIIQPTLARVGLRGSSGLDPQRMVAALGDYRATSCIMIPQMLLALVAQVAANPDRRPAHLRFAAVGGAPVSPALLTRAEQLGLPVFEGYGLSEAASVVAVNRPDARKIGSVGKPLPHVTLRTADDGELWVKGALMEGYLDHDGTITSQCDSDGFWPTGDLGHLDDEGFLHLEGRIKQIFITAFGRNVAPEWVEKELTIEPEIAQAALFGEAKPFNVAVIVARDPAGVEAAVARANARLPDYARVGRVVLATAPFSTDNGQAATNGTPLRHRIAEAYRDAIGACYSKE